MNQRYFQFSFALVVAAAAAAALAQQAGPAPDVARLKKHVTYLASEELGGRKTGEGGAKAAAAYIAEQFHDSGLGCPSPGLACRHRGGGRDGYLQEFPFVAAVELARDNSLRVSAGGEKSEAQLREEWLPLGFSSNGRVDAAPAVFVGYGITAAGQKHDDYAGVDARGKVAVAFAGTPDGDNPHGELARFGETRWKAVAAKDHGAAALLVIAREEKFRDDRLSRLSYDQMAGEAGLPVAAVSRQLAARLLGPGAAARLAEVEKGGGAPPAMAGVTVSLLVEVARRTVAGYNVAGVIEGADPKLKDEHIVIGAHYDHLGRGGEGSRAPESGEVHHGADDNASGVAGLLELARIFAAERRGLRRSLVFVAFGGEESGLIGSHHYVNHPFLPLANAAAMINMDMIGRLRDDKLTVGGMGTAAEFSRMLEESNAGPRAPRFALQLSRDGFGPSDHSSFYAKKVPVLFFYTGVHEDYHKPSDTAEKINYEGQARIVAYATELIRKLDRADARPTYTAAPSPMAGGARAGGFRVYLGTIPSYAESTDGLALEGVRDDSPAAKSGLKAGDKIVRLAGREIKNVYDYTYVLGEMKADQEYEVEVLRDGGRVKLKLVPQARK